MQLRRLEVRNIRSYETGRVEFSPGTTLIVGDVGAGKTSLLYAIEMALFGVAEVDAAYLVRHGAGHAEVAVRFEDGEHRYDVGRRFRRIRRKGRETFESEEISFREDGVKTTYSATEVRHRVIELLGFPDNPNPQAHSDLWRWAIYVPQERMREILSARAQDRLETIRKALGVERYRTAAENAQELAADVRASARHRRELAGRLGHYDLEFADATQAADRLRLERAERERTLARLVAEQESARVRSEEAERAAHRLEAELREAESLAREQGADQHGIAERRRLASERASESSRRSAEREANRAEAAEVASRRAAFAAAEARLKEARGELDRHAGEIRALAAARAELAAAERRHEELGSRLRRATSDRDAARVEAERAAGEGPAREPPVPTPASLAEIERKIAEARAKERAAVERLARARSGLAEIDELLAGGVCPRCHQAVRPDAFGPHREESAAAVRAAEEEGRAAEAAIASLDAERKARERYERAHERWIEVEKRRASLREAARRRDEEFAELSAASTEAERTLAAAREKVRALEPEELRAEGYRRAVADAEASGERAREALDRALHAEERVRALDEALRALAAESERAERELAALERRMREREGRLAELAGSTRDRAAIEEALRAARAERTAAERRLAEEREAMVRADTRLDSEVRRVAAAEKGRAERAAFVAEADLLERTAAWASGPFRVSLLTMERELLAHAQATFDRSFARFFAALVDDPALVARTDSGFTPEVLIEGEATPAEALSGGERTALALAFRLALADVVRSLGEVRLETLLLDEPTDGFSAEQVIRMGELLGELALPQVIIVSHEGQLASVADRTVRVRKEDGRAVLETDRPPEPGSLIETDAPRPRRGARAPAREPDAT